MPAVVMTLDEIVSRNALRFPARTALAMGEGAQTWRELEERVNRLTTALELAGWASATKDSTMAWRTALLRSSRGMSQFHENIKKDAPRLSRVRKLATDAALCQATPCLADNWRQSV